MCVVGGGGGGGRGERLSRRPFVAFDKRELKKVGHNNPNFYFNIIQYNLAYTV